MSWGFTSFIGGGTGFLKKDEESWMGYGGRKASGVVGGTAGAIGGELLGDVIGGPIGGFIGSTVGATAGTYIAENIYERSTGYEEYLSEAELEKKKYEIGLGDLASPQTLGKKVSNNISRAVSG